MSVSPNLSDIHKEALARHEGKGVEQLATELTAAQLFSEKPRTATASAWGSETLSRSESADFAGRSFRRSAAPRSSLRLPTPDSPPVDSGRGYFPRAVFFFGFGLLVLPDLSGAGSFFGRFGDTFSLLPWPALLWWLRVRIRSEAPSRAAERSDRR